MPHHHGYRHQVLLRTTPVKIQPVIECFCGIYRVLTGHRVNHKQYLVRVNGRFNISYFGHHHFIDGRPHAVSMITIFLFKLLACLIALLAISTAFLFFRFAVYINLDLLSKNLQLLNRRGAINIRRYQQWETIPFYFEIIGELPLKVVLPLPCKPAIRITAGLPLVMTSLSSSTPLIRRARL